MKFKSLKILLLAVVFNLASGQGRQWTPDGNSYYDFNENGVEVVNLLNPSERVSFLSAAELIPKGADQALKVQSFEVSKDGDKLLLFADTKRVWRLNTRGDYWVFNKNEKNLRQLGKDLPKASLMFAKFSPDGQKAAYVSKHNIYLEDVETGERKAITTDGTDRMINGTFDWVYEEEFGARDGFRWSPDGKKIAYWKVDARKIRNFLMIDNTNSLYSYTIPVEYPKVGQDPSGVSIWIYDVASGKTLQAQVPGDAVQHYIPRMEWIPDSKGIILQQLNRKQNESKIFTVSAENGQAKEIYKETDPAWIDIKTRWAGTPEGWDWLDNGKEFIWLSEKDGWRHIYKIDLLGREKLLTAEPFDVININYIDVPHKVIYFTASPKNATQKFLYKVGIKGGKETRVTPAEYEGTNTYTISPNGKLAVFNSSSTALLSTGSVVSLPSHKELKAPLHYQKADAEVPHAEFFQIKTEDKVTLDGWMVKPKNFDPAKKYPVVFYVYGEPASQTVTDNFYQGNNFLYDGDFSGDGYVYISLENRGAPAPRGRAWRKSIYRNIGQINIRDQAMGAKEILKWDFIDPDRVAVWGWSGGGASTLNLLGQYPEIYKTGISIAPVTNQLYYDNIYQERYMGLPQENEEDFLKGSAVTYAKNVKGNLLLIHGTGDDNVHYQNAEAYVNELIKYNIPFQMMSYPNRSHSISEGPGTSQHLRTIYTKFLRENCPPGGR